jgi:hypothetical protein
MNSGPCVDGPMAGRDLSYKYKYYAAVIVENLPTPADADKGAPLSLDYKYGEYAWDDAASCWRWRA